MLDPDKYLLLKSRIGIEICCQKQTKFLHKEIFEIPFIKFRIRCDIKTIRISSLAFILISYINWEIKMSLRSVNIKKIKKFVEIHF